MVLPQNKAYTPKKTSYLILFLLASARPSQSFIFTALTTAFTTAYTLYGLFNDADDAVRKWTPSNNIDNVLEAVDGVSKKIDTIEINLATKLDDALNKLLISLPLIDRIDAGMRDLSNYIIDIDTLYETFEYYIEEKDDLDNATLLNFASSIGGTDSDDLIPLLEKMSKLIAPSRTSGFRQSLVVLLTLNTKDHYSKQCNNGAPAESLLSDIYSAVMTTEMRGILMTGFAYYVLSTLGEGSYKAEMRIARKRMVRRLENYRKVFGRSDPFIGLQVYRCDTKYADPFDTETFFPLLDYRVKYVISELGLDPSGCNISCDNRTEPVAHNNCTHYEICDKRHYCNGHLTACKRSGSMSAMLSTDEDSSAIYTAIEIADTASLFGRDGFDTITDAMYDNQQRQCFTCLCDCVRDLPDSPGLHFISFREAVSDIENNRVITGLRLLHTESCMHIAIQQGTVVSQGNVDPNSTEWETIQLRDPNYTFDLVHGSINFDTVAKQKNDDLVEGKDYGLLTADRYAIYLDDVLVPKDYVVTDNVRLAFTKPGIEPKGLQIEVRGTPYDFLTGQLLLVKSSPSVWFTPQDMKGVYEEYDQEREEYPIDKAFFSSFEGIMSDLTEPRSKRNSYVGIHTSDLSSEGGQVTLPYIDSLKNFGRPPFAVSALGLFYKSAIENGPGFVSNRMTLLDPIIYLEFDPDVDLPQQVL